MAMFIFVVLDSQIFEEADFNPSLLKEEQTWLETDLGNTQKEWKVALWHKTPYPTKSVRTNENIKDAFLAIMDKYHVDVAFNAHDHSYARTYPLNNDTITTTDSGTVYIITGRSGAKYYNDNAQKVWDSEFYDPQDLPIYSVIDVNGSVLTIKVYKADGTLIDDYSIDKNGKDIPFSTIPTKYNKTRLVINGALLNQPLVPAFPSQLSGKWYLPIKAAVGFLGGSESDSDKTATISMNVQNYVGENIPWSDGKKSHGHIDQFQFESDH